MAGVQNPAQTVTVATGPGAGTVSTSGIVGLATGLMATAAGAAYGIWWWFPRCEASTTPGNSQTSSAAPVAGQNASDGKTGDGGVGGDGGDSLSVLTIEPSRVATPGGPVVVAGTGFRPGLRVFMDGRAATDVRVEGTRFLTATAPPHGPGTVTLMVRDGRAIATLPGGVTYVCLPPPDTHLIVLVLLAGMLGGLLHALRSLYWYVGHRRLLRSWVLMYVLLPFTGAGLALMFFLVARAGFYDGTENASIVFVGLAALVGMFSTQAAQKLKDIAEGLFTKGDQGANHVPSRPSPAPPAGPATPTASVTPASGPADGGTTVTITGVAVASGTTVLFGSLPAGSVSVVDATTLTATTPAHPAGPVDISVTVAGGSPTVIAGGFTFV